MWLAIFFTAIPVGTAMGYVYSASVATSLGWQYCFFIEGMMMAPFVLYMFHISPHFPPPHRHTHGDSAAAGGARKPSTSSSLSHTSSLLAADPSSEIMMLHKISSHLQEYDRDRDRGEGCEEPGQVYEPLIQSSASPPPGPPPADGQSPVRYRRVSSNMALLPDPAPGSTSPTPHGSAPLQSGEQEEDGEREEEVPSVSEELRTVLTTPVYLCMVLGYAAQTASLIGK